MSKNVFAVLAVALFGAVVSACATPTPITVVQTSVPQVIEKIITPTPGPAAPKAGSVAINGAGATFPFPIYSRWFYDYAFVDTAAKINYQSIGSGGGIAAITSKTVDFGASDALLTDAQYTAAPGIQALPMVAGGIVPAYNLKDTDGKLITDTIKFSYTALADIYLGKIKTWDDPVLKSANPNIKLPAKNINIVRRSDGSGTTFVFTDYLSKVSDEWKTKVGSANSVSWPVEGVGGKGNEGATAMVALSDGTLGYVEYTYAKQNGLTYGSVQNKAGNYPIASPTTVQADLQDFGTNMGDKLMLSVVNGTGKDSWPISTYTYLLVYKDQTDCTKGKKVIDFVKWALTDPAAIKSAQSLDYLTLPDDIVKQVQAKIGTFTCQGKPF